MDTVTFFWFAVNALAVHRITRLISADTIPIIRKPREWLLRRWPSEDTVFMPSEVTVPEHDPAYVDGTTTVVFQDGDEWFAIRPHWLGDLVTCAWCVSMYVAPVVIAADYFWDWWPWVAISLAYSTVTGLLGNE